MESKEIVSIPPAYAIQCPKCGHIRSESDLVPSWQCPSCQVVYAKAIDRVEDRNRELPLSVVPQQQKKGVKYYILLLIKTFLLCFLMIVLFLGYIIYHKFDSTNVETSPVVAPDNGVIVYSMEQCGNCDMAKKFLSDNDVRFEEYNINTSEKGRQDFDKLDGWGVPVIVVGDKRIYGYNEKTLSGLLRTKGLLK